MILFQCVIQFTNIQKISNKKYQIKNIMKKIKKKIYESYFSSHYSFLDNKQENIDLLRNSNHGKKYLEFLPKELDSRIVDLGCGTGSLVSGLLNCGYTNVSGIDVSEENVQQGKLAGLSIKHREIIDFINESLSKNNKYDVVFLLDVLEHLDDDELYEVVDGVKKVLDKNGCFIIKTINAESLISGMGRYMDITHERSFTSYSLRELMNAFEYKNFKILNSKINKPRNFKEHIRNFIRRQWYSFIYRIIESRHLPECIDVDIYIKVNVD